MPNKAAKHPNADLANGVKLIEKWAKQNGARATVCLRLSDNATVRWSHGPLDTRNTPARFPKEARDA